MLSQIPTRLKNMSSDKIDQEILRAAIIAELDAVNLYEQMASLASQQAIRDILFDVAKEEKTHIGEFQALLLKRDLEQHVEMKKGAEEVEEILGHE